MLCSISPEEVMADDALGRVCPPSVIKWLNHPMRKLIQNPKKIMGAFVKPGDVAVDVGCGGGFFAVELADMVGENGRVIAVDLQEEMLEFTRNLAAKRHVLERITLHRCDAENIALPEEKVDFVLAFYVVHEVPNRRAFLSQISRLMKSDARFLMIEPKHHVTPELYESILGDATSAGLEKFAEIKIAFSRGVVFKLTS
jgi:ubiquinone/menaquinone biosynthesis C-methylase UbiE